MQYTTQYYIKEILDELHLILQQTPRPADSEKVIQSNFRANIREVMIKFDTKESDLRTFNAYIKLTGKEKETLKANKKLVYRKLATALFYVRAKNEEEKKEVDKKYQANPNFYWQEFIKETDLNTNNMKPKEEDSVIPTNPKTPPVEGVNSPKIIVQPETDATVDKFEEIKVNLTQLMADKKYAEFFEAVEEIDEKQKTQLTDFIESLVVDNLREMKKYLISLVELSKFANFFKEAGQLKAYKKIKFDLLEFSLLEKELLRSDNKSIHYHDKCKVWVNNLKK